MKVDSIAAWVNDCLIFDPTAKTPVGNKRDEGDTLFGSYCRHCDDNGSQGKSNKGFSPDLVEILTSVLGWKVERKSTNTAKVIAGVRLRVPGEDDNIATPEIFLAEKIGSDGSSDGSELLQDKACDGSDGSSLHFGGNKNEGVVGKGCEDSEEGGHFSLDSLPEKGCTPSPAKNENQKPLLEVIKKEAMPESVVVDEFSFPLTA